eukprot:s1725_g4.t1
MGFLRRAPGADQGSAACRHDAPHEPAWALDAAAEGQDSVWKLDAKKMLQVKRQLISCADGPTLKVCYGVLLGHALFFATQQFQAR